MDFHIVETFLGEISSIVSFKFTKLEKKQVELYIYSSFCSCYSIFAMNLLISKPCIIPRFSHFSICIEIMHKLR